MIKQCFWDHVHMHNCLSIVRKPFLTWQVWFDLILFINDYLAYKEARKCIHVFVSPNLQVIERVAEDIRRVGTAKRLTSFEIPRKVLLDPDPWTPESGLVTDALKIKRFNIKKKFEEDITRMYAE